MYLLYCVYQSSMIYQIYVNEDERMVSQQSRNIKFSNFRPDTKSELFLCPFFSWNPIRRSNEVEILIKILNCGGNCECTPCSTFWLDFNISIQCVQSKEAFLYRNLDFSIFPQFFSKLVQISGLFIFKTLCTSWCQHGYGLHKKG